MKNFIIIAVLGLLAFGANAQSTVPFNSYRPVQTPQRSYSTPSYPTYSTPNYSTPSTQNSFVIVTGYYYDPSIDDVRSQKLKINTVSGPRVYVRGVYDYMYDRWDNYNSEATRTYTTIDGDIANYYQWKITIPSLRATVYFNN